MRFLTICLWECLQNLPIFTGFTCAFGALAKGSAWGTLAWAVAGGVCGATLIALTESRKTPGHQESLPVALSNALAITVFIFAIVVYLTTRGTNWWTDLMLGSLGGAGLAAMQSVAARKKIDLRHCVALGVASAVVIAGIRILLHTGWPVWLNVLCMTLLASLIISLIDYLPGRPAAHPGAGKE
jgi:hypothetical protein